MSEDAGKKEENSTENTASESDQGQPQSEGQRQEKAAPSGPTFTPGSDPLAGVKKGTADIMASMEGKTVPMKVYVGTIIGVILLMMLARCGD